MRQRFDVLQKNRETHLWKHIPHIPDLLSDLPQLFLRPTLALPRLIDGNLQPIDRTVYFLLLLLHRCALRGGLSLDGGYQFRHLVELRG